MECVVAAFSLATGMALSLGLAILFEEAIFTGLLRPFFGQRLARTPAVETRPSQLRQQDGSGAGAGSGARSHPAAPVPGPGFGSAVSKSFGGTTNATGHSQPNR